MNYASKSVFNKLYVMIYFNKIAVVTKRCNCSNISKIILYYFFFYSSLEEQVISAAKTSSEHLMESHATSTSNPPLETPIPLLNSTLLNAKEKSSMTISIGQDLIQAAQAAQQG